MLVHSALVHSHLSNMHGHISSDAKDPMISMKLS